VIQGSNPITEKIFLFLICPDQLSAYCSVGVRVISRDEADYPPPSTAKVKNVWRCTLTPYIHLQGVEWENLTFLLPFYLYVPCGGFCLGRFSS
jgi:hypothetical protein